MDTINIDSGVKRIAIKRDGEDTGVISFNPSDGLFAEKFYRLLKDLQSKQADFTARGKEVDSHNDLDENGILKNVDDRFALMKEFCSYMREQIDIVFGPGTSQIAFGDSLNVNMFTDFLNGIKPFIEQARAKKIAPYQKRPHNKVMP